MKELLSKVQTKNQETIKKKSSILFKIQGLMILIAITLLIIDSDQLLTPAVLLIFFSFILLIISLFVLALHTTKNLNVKIKNSIDIIYQSNIREFNDHHGTSYTFKTDDYPNEDWYLIPSYAQKDINYCLHDEDYQIKMYHAQSYTAAGNPPRRTIYFSGLYVVLKGVEGDMQYRDQDGISGSIINTLKSVYGKDLNDVGQYSKKTRYESGILYSQDTEEMPEVLKTLISALRTKPFVHRITVAIKNGELHVALEQKSIRLPYVKKYQDEDLIKIKNNVEENATLLKEIEQIVSIN